MSKCSVIFGDVTEVDLGITTKDRETLKKEVDFIIHSAATTRFDDTLEYTIKMNTRGTKYMLELAEQCDHLKVRLFPVFRFILQNHSIQLSVKSEILFFNTKK